MLLLAGLIFSLILSGKNFQTEAYDGKQVDVNTYKYDIQLKGEDNQEISLEVLLDQLKGTVVYLDFWSSWCGPCRMAMPDALKLREEYENSELSFVYFTIEDKDESWRESIRDLQLNDKRAMNFFILNSDSSQTIEDWNIIMIPRYLIFDKSGKLVNKRAPGPSGNEIREILDELLK